MTLLPVNLVKLGWTREGEERRGRANNPHPGQSNHFLRYCPQDIPYGRDRYRNETRRLYGVLDKHLVDAKADYLVGNKCTIADIANWGWITLGAWAGVEIEEFPVLKKWQERMSGREGVERGR